MNMLGYAVGDSVHIFGRYDFSTGVVERITASGQIVVKQGDWTRRFLPRGKEVGASVWSHIRIWPKDEQEAIAVCMREQERDRVAQRLLRNRCADIAKRRVQGERAEIVADLRALADELEASATGEPA